MWSLLQASPSLNVPSTQLTASPTTSTPYCLAQPSPSLTLPPLFRSEDLQGEMTGRSSPEKKTVPSKVELL